MGEGGHKVQTSRYKMIKSQGCKNHRGDGVVNKTVSYI